MRKTKDKKLVINETKTKKLTLVKKEKKKIVVCDSNEVESVSVCGNYRSFLNSTGLNYIRCKTTEEIFQKDRKIVYKTLKECEDQLIEKLNKYGDQNGATSFNFHLRPSGKFLNVRCANCKTFYYQYKNKNNQEMSEFF